MRLRLFFKSCQWCLSVILGCFFQLWVSNAWISFQLFLLSSMTCVVVLIRRMYDQCSGLWKMLSITCSCLFCEKIILFIIKLLFFQFYMDDCLQRLIDKIDTDGSLKNLTPSDCISKLIRFRLEMQAPYISTWPQALSIQVSACPFSCRLRYLWIVEMNEFLINNLFTGTAG